MVMEGKILIVEDEEGLRSSLRDYFQREGFQVEVAVDGRQAIAALDDYRPDLVILDVQLPYRDGLEICREVRRRYDHGVDIIMVSGKKMELMDKVVGLEIGADVYLFKPFETRELLAQVRALLRRRHALGARSEDNGWYNVDQRLRIHFQKRLVEVNQKPVHLTRLEFDLLQKLAEQPDMPFTRSTLLDEVWGYANTGEYSDAAINTCISKLRAKIEPDPGNPQYIISVHGVGYRFSTD
jgi:two-component system response regulator VicR